MKDSSNNLMRDLAIIAFSVAIAISAVKMGTLKALLAYTEEGELIGSFVAGIFFTSVFTTALATVTLAEIAQSHSVIWVAFFGGMGALVGDLVIFHFIKTRLSEDISFLVKATRSERLVSIFRLRLFKWLIPFIGALIVASPLPDELGLAMLGFSKMKTLVFVPISFTLNFLGILVIGLIAKTVL